MPTNTQYRWIAHALSVLDKVGADITIVPAREGSPGRVEVILNNYNPPEYAEPGEPSLPVQYLLNRIRDQHSVDVSSNEHIVRHLEAIVEKTLRNGSAPNYQIPFPTETEDGVVTRVLTINSRDPVLRELLDR